MATSNSNAAPTGRNIACPECAEPNETSRRFCGNCGQRLWEPCGACQEPNSRAVEFCGSCGVNLTAQFDTTRRDIAERLKKSEQLRTEGRFRDAISQLSLAPRTEDSRLVPLIHDIPDRIERLNEELATATGQARQNLAEALQLQKNNDHVAAAELLNKIPVGLRTSSTERAISASQAVLGQIRDLNTKIRSAIKEKRTQGLLPDVLKLLELRPNDEKLTTLAEQLRQRQRLAENATAAQTLVKAKATFSERKYGTAARLLEGVDIASIAETSQPLYHAIREVAWSVELIRHDPFLTNQLTTIARRWQKICDKDLNAARALQDLTKLVAKHSQQKSAVIKPRGSKSVQAFGAPVYWWRGLSRTKVEEDAQDFQSAPTRFMIAHGLALQGLGLAHVNQNLLPKQERSFFSLPKLRKSGGGENEVWGVDLGSSGLKAVLLKRESGDSQVTMRDAYCVSHADAIVEATNDVETQQVFRQSLETWIEEREIDQAAVVLGLPGPRTLVRTFEIPNFQGKKAADAIAYETKMQIPMSIEEIHYDWHAWPSSSDDGSRQVTLVAARRDHVQHVLGACEDLPLRPVAVQSACLALYNTAIFDQFDSTATAETPETPLVTGILDLGAESSTLVVATPSYLRFRSMSVGTHRLDQHLVTSRNLTRSQAQRTRTKPETAKWLYDFDQCTCDVYDELLHEVRRTLRAYVGDGVTIDRMLITGGASEQVGMLRFVASQDH